jgi:hypothetical protein
MNNKILNKLIELGYVIEHPQSSPFNTRRDSDFLLIQRALFEECAKRDYEITIAGNQLGISTLKEGMIDSFICTRDTSRESFVAAFEKVAGI